MTAIILSGGGPGPAPSSIPPADLVIAADSGLHLAGELGLSVDLVVGDLDSVDRAHLEATIAAGAELEQHPTGKDATDLDLAMQAAQRRGATRLVIAGGGEGRLDHLLTTAALMASPRWRNITIEWFTSGAAIYPVTAANRRIDTQPGDPVSLIPAGGDARVSIAGTQWELHDEWLAFGSTRGTSNEAKAGEVHLEVLAGTVLLIHAGGPR